MKKLLWGSALILMALAITIPAQAQTVEERLTALETSMANVELLSTQLFQLFSALQPDIVAILNALATQQAEVAALQASMAAVEADVSTLQSSDSTQDNSITALQSSDSTQDGLIAANTAGIASNANDIAAIVVPDISGLTTDVGELQTRFNGVSRTGDTLLLTDMNLQVVSGSGDTDGTVNGKGNIIIGYNEDIFPYMGGVLPASDKTGSHNLVVGKGLNYSSYGALVSGMDNVSGAEYASVIAGSRNQATAYGSSVSGGTTNITSGVFSSVSGGGGNLASGQSSSVSGGSNNTASGNSSSVSGGSSNTASGNFSSVSGRISNRAFGGQSTVSGGLSRTTVGQFHWRAGNLFQSE